MPGRDLRTKRLIGPFVKKKQHNNKRRGWKCVYSHRFGEPRKEAGTLLMPGLNLPAVLYSSVFVVNKGCTGSCHPRDWSDLALHEPAIRSGLAIIGYHMCYWAISKLISELSLDSTFFRGAISSIQSMDSSCFLSGSLGRNKSRITKLLLNYLL